MLLKAGTYRFNDVLSFASMEFVALPFISNSQNFVGIVTNGTSIDSWGVVGVINLETEELVPIYAINYGGLDGGWQGDYQTHNITQDTEVDDTFGTWYKANTDYNTVNSALGWRKFNSTLPSIRTVNDFSAIDNTSFFIKYGFKTKPRFGYLHGGISMPTTGLSCPIALGETQHYVTRLEDGSYWGAFRDFNNSIIKITSTQNKTVDAWILANSQPVTGMQLIDMCLVSSDGPMSYTGFLHATGALVHTYYCEKEPENPQETSDTIMNVYYIAEQNVIGAYQNGAWDYLPVLGVVDDIADIPEYDPDNEDDQFYALIVNTSEDTAVQEEPDAIPNEIKFNVDNNGTVTSYSAENGMDWYDWLRTEYADGSLTLVWVGSSTVQDVALSSDTSLGLGAKATDDIVDGKTYVVATIVTPEEPEPEPEEPEPDPEPEPEPEEISYVLNDTLTAYTGDTDHTVEVSGTFYSRAGLQDSTIVQHSISSITLKAIQDEYTPLIVIKSSDTPPYALTQYVKGQWYCKYVGESNESGGYHTDEADVTLLETLSVATFDETLCNWLKDNSRPPLISFTITVDETVLTFQADEGMTWSEWIISDYNAGVVELSNSEPYYMLIDDGVRVDADLEDVIIDGYAYSTIVEEEPEPEPEPEEPETPTKKFTRLYKGYTVATSGTKVFKKLTTEEIVAIYLLNETLSPLPANKEITSRSYYIEYNIEGYLQYNKFPFDRIGYDYTWTATSIGDHIVIGTTRPWQPSHGHYRYYSYKNGDPQKIDNYNINADSIRYGNYTARVYDKNSDIGIQLRTLIITGGADINDERLATWLKANATKIA